VIIGVDSNGALGHVPTLTSNFEIVQLTSLARKLQI